MTPVSPTEMERLEERRRTLKEREQQLLATCEQLERGIREVRDRVKESAELVSSDMKDEK
jgi:hypothetical protein